LRNSSESIASLAKKQSFVVAAGCWLSPDKKANQREVNFLMNEIKKGNVDLAIVGSEALHRKNLNASDLIGYVQQIKRTGIPVTVDDTFKSINDNPELISYLDKVMVNIYPYWRGSNINLAYDDFMADYYIIKNKYRDKEIIIGETGWPSQGNKVGEAIPNQSNFLKYAKRILSWANSNRVKCYYFEAFDEPWKASAEGPQGAHWGLWTKTMVPKSGIIELFKQIPTI
jgi:exo-beta-1,3-glucanase (GH17 family)